jgi:hypothetical protein
MTKQGFHTYFYSPRLHPRRKACIPAFCSPNPMQAAKCNAQLLVTILGALLCILRR